MVAKKRMILWDWSNSVAGEAPEANREMSDIPFGNRSAISSVYNWNAWAPKELHGRAPFRPMVRTMAQTSDSDWDLIENTSEHLILFFNEPERNGISPEKARDVWYRQMLPLRRKKGKKLGSPAVAADVNGKVWISEWMKLVERDPPDFLCLHYYSPDGNAAIGYLQAMHRKFPEHHIMVTEIASTDRNYESVLGFTVQVVNWMDETP